VLPGVYAPHGSHVDGLGDLLQALPLADWPDPKGGTMLPRFKRDYGTMKCGYCKREVEKAHANSKFCCHNCAASNWYDEHKRVGPKPKRIIVEGSVTTIEAKTEGGAK
jgi:hypothetical protein